MTSFKQEIKSFFKISLTSLVLFTLAIISNYTSPVFAVTYLGKNEHGERLYKCQGYCGKVRVRKVGRNIYRIYSIPFSGELKASSAKNAAKAACREDNSVLEDLTNPGPSRNIPNC